ncbi:hypothetical protein GCM10010277_07560 [Streptomyces longisporoflavus]|nr:hypothetical protein GCM10010277_07560 [Streptomyces longisporoflavus]
MTAAGPASAAAAIQVAAGAAVARDEGNETWIAERFLMSAGSGRSGKAGCRDRTVRSDTALRRAASQRLLIAPVNSG